MATVTLKQIAEKVGVTPMTVSSALSGKGRIGEVTRERVLQAAQALGYRPNASARATRRGKFDCIGLLVSSDKQYSYTPDALLWGIQAELEETGNHLAMARLPSGFDGSEANLPKCLRERILDGMLINLTHHLPPRITEAVSASRVPAVWMNTRMSCDCVYPDDRSAARELTRRMIERGHRRIAFVNYGPEASTPEEHQDRHYSEFDRLAGYMDAMAAAELPPRIVQPAAYLPHTEWLPYSRAWLEAPDRPTAALVYRVSAARPVAAAAMSMGLTVGKDLTIHTFGEYPITDECLGMSIAVVPFLEVGKLAARMLLKKVALPDVPVAAQAVPFSL